MNSTHSERRRLRVCWLVNSLPLAFARVLACTHFGGHLTNELAFKIGDGDLEVPPRQRGSDLTGVT